MPDKDPFAAYQMPLKSGKDDPFAAYQEPAAPTTEDTSEFAFKPGDQHGKYRMKSPSGKDIDVGYENVMNASKKGYKIHPDDREVYANDYVEEKRKKAVGDVRSKNKGVIPGLDFVSKAVTQHMINPDTDLPQAYDVVKAGPKKWSLDWVKQKANDLTSAHAILDQLSTVGSISGGTAAAAAAAESGPGVIPARIAGAGAGAAAGEYIRQKLETVLYPYEHRPSAEENKRRIAIEAGMGAAAEGAGLGGSKIIGIAVKPLQETAAASEKAGFRMMPSEALGTHPSVFETYPKGSIFTSGQMAEWRVAQNQETEQAARDLADTISKKSLGKTGSREEAGNIVRNGIETHMEKYRKAQQAAYNRIDKVAKNNSINPSRKDVIDFAKKVLNQAKSTEKSYGKSRMTPFKQALQDIVDNDLSNASWADAKDFRSKLLSEVRNDNSLMSGPEKSVLSKIAGIVDGSMEDAIKKSKVPGLYDLWRSANKITREEHEKFEQKLIENLAAKKNPEDIALVLRGNSPGAISQIGIQETRDAMSVIPKQMIPRVQKQILLDTLYEASGKGTTPFNEKMFAKKTLQIGDERGEVLFGKNWSNVKEFSESLNKLSESGGLQSASLSNPEVVKQVGRLALESITSVAGARAAGGPTLLAGVAPIMTEAALWKTVATALTHPVAASRFLKGMQVLARTGPYVGMGAGNVGRGEEIGKGETPDERRLDAVKQKAKDLQDKMSPTPAPVAKPSAQPAVQAPVVIPQQLYDEDGNPVGPQSSAKPTWTHTYNPSTGQIEAV